MAIVVQILARNGQVQKQHVIDKEEVNVGRGFINDIILSDAHVCPHHLTIARNENDDLIITDNDSLNGTYRNQDAISHSTEISADDVFVVGKTRLRILPSDHGVAPTLPISPLEEILQPLSLKLTAALIVLTYVVVMLVNQYVMSISEFKVAKQFPNILGALFVISLWPLLFALIARLRKHEAKLTSQISVTFIFALAIFTYICWENLMAYNYPGLALMSWLSPVILVFLLGALFWFNLFLSSQQTNKVRTIVASVLSIGVVGLLNLFSYTSQSDFNARPQYNSTMLPPAFRMAAPVSTQSFAEQANQLFEKADEKAKEKTE